MKDNKYKTGRVAGYRIRVGMVLLDGGEVTTVTPLPDGGVVVRFAYCAPRAIGRHSRQTYYPNM